MFENLFLRHLEEDEPIYLVVHKHWIMGAKSILTPALTIVLTLVFLYFAPLPVIAAAVVCLDAGILVWLLRNFFDYYLDAWIITDRSVIDVEWHGWFHRKSTRIDYSTIEGVSYEIKGIIGTVLQIGSVSLERIGAGTVVSMEYVKHPRDIESAILACQDACIRTKNMKDSSAVKDIIAEIVAERIFLKEEQS